MVAQTPKLERYNVKRDFARTPEPMGEVAASGRVIFMVQKHAATRLHWDFRLELDGVLLSWAVTRGPSANPEDKRLAVRTEDHPLSYSTFEGTIPKGEYGGGTVMLWDRGTWTPHPGKDPVKTLAEGHLHFTLDGERMRGEWIMVRLKPRPKEKQESWLLRKVADAEAGPDLAAEFMTSVASGRTMAEIAAGAPPSPSLADARIFLPPVGGGSSTLPPKVRGTGATRHGVGTPPAFRAPMLATLTDVPPTGNDWLHEVKFDGYRLLVAVGGGRVECWTRNGNAFAPPSLAPLVAELARLPGSALLDGEVCVLDHHGRPHFSLLKNSLKEGSAPLDLFVFDALEIDGEDLTGLPLTERKARLQALLKPLKPPIHYTDHVRGEGERVLAALCERDFEGIISKRADSRYGVGKRGPAWLKIKCGRRQEFVIGGWSRSDKRAGFAALLLGYHRDGALVYAGKVGTGFDNAEITRLSETMATMVVDPAPFADVPREAKRGATWVRPELVCEVAFTEFTPDGHLRHPSYLGLREDKAASEVLLEIASPAPGSAPPPSPSAPSPPLRRGGKDALSSPVHGGGGPRSGTEGARHGIMLTNPDRVIFPEAGITKAMLADYYETVASLLIEEIANRPLSLVRCPQGRGKQCFFQKHDSGMFPDAVKRVDLHETTSEGAERQPYLYVDDIAGVLAVVQMGALELHIWGSRLPNENLPDRLVFDLDPDEGLGFASVIEGALDLRARLKARGLESWPMLSGGKGVHVIVPIAPEHGWDVVKPWCHDFARAAAADKPDRYTATLAKKARGGKIFIDYLRNGRGATAIAPYSTRAREGAPVAAPVSWTELRGMTTGAAFGVRDAAALLKRAKYAALKGWARSGQRLPV